jgi:hypothetical protein
MTRAVSDSLCRRHTEATLSEHAEWLGHSRADSIPNLTRRMQTRLTSQPELLNDFAEILRRVTSEEVDRRPRTLNSPKAKHRQGGRETKNQL